MAWSPSSTVPTSRMPGTLRMASSKSMRSSSESSASRTEYILVGLGTSRDGTIIRRGLVMSRIHRRGGHRRFIGQKIEMAPPLIQSTREQDPLLDAGRLDDKGIYAEFIGGIY